MVTANKGKRKRSAYSVFKQNLPLTFLALPAIIYVFIFSYIPLYGLLLPFKKYIPSLGFFKSPWVGLDNFRFIIGNEAITTATRNTLLYNLAFIVLGLIVSLAIALMLFEMRASQVKTYQTCLFLPYFISWVVASYAVKVFLDIDYGLFNSIIVRFGGDPITWYNTPKYWPAILIVAEIWKAMGYNALIYYAALMSVDKSLFEAAQIDGAGKLKQIWYISIPSIKPMIVLMTILKIGKIFYGDFGLFYNLTLNSSLLYPTTDIIDTYVYRALFEMNDISIASTVGFYQSVLGFLLVIFTNWIVNKIDSDSALF